MIDSTSSGGSGLSRHVSSAMSGMGAFFRTERPEDRSEQESLLSRSRTRATPHVRY